MPKFAYKGMDQEGKESYGVIEADSEADALSKIGRTGLLVTEVRAANVTDEWRLKWREQRDQYRRAEQEKQDRRKAAHPRQRLVVRYLDGRTLYGVSFALNPRESSFHLDTVDAEGRTTGEVVQVRFGDLKAVFLVKSFDGNFDKSQRFPYVGEIGREMVVEFKDGEAIRGHTLRHYDPDDMRFHLIPRDQNTNNISVLVERSALVGVYSPEEYKEKLERDREAQRREGATSLTQEETMGDFYFETRNYEAALTSYEDAVRSQPQSTRLRRKVLAAKYNIGVQHIKRREYEQALRIMEEVQKVDPANDHAKKKILQLRKVVDREREGKSRRV